MYNCNVLYSNLFSSHYCLLMSVLYSMSLLSTDVSNGIVFFCPRANLPGFFLLVLCFGGSHGQIAGKKKSYGQFPGKKNVSQQITTHIFYHHHGQPSSTPPPPTTDELPSSRSSRSTLPPPPPRCRRRRRASMAPSRTAERNAVTTPPPPLTMTTGAQYLTL